MPEPLSGLENRQSINEAPLNGSPQPEGKSIGGYRTSGAVDWPERKLFLLLSVS